MQMLFDMGGSKNYITIFAVGMEHQQVKNCSKVTLDFERSITKHGGCSE